MQQSTNQWVLSLTLSSLMIAILLVGLGAGAPYASDIQSRFAALGLAIAVEFKPRGRRSEVRRSRLVRVWVSLEMSLASVGDRSCRIRPVPSGEGSLKGRWKPFARTAANQLIPCRILVVSMLKTVCRNRQRTILHKQIFVRKILYVIRFSDSQEFSCRIEFWALA